MYGIFVNIPNYTFEIRHGFDQSVQTCTNEKVSLALSWL